MKKPVTYNSGAQTDFGVKQGNNEVGNLNADYGSDLGGLTWYNSLDTDSQYVIYSNTFDLGLTDEPSALPVFWQTDDRTEVNVMKIINGLPDRRGEIPFTSAAEAIAWVNNSNKYYFLTTGGQSWFSVVRVGYSDNFFYAVLDYASNNASLIDSGVDSNDWYQDDIYPINNSGYAALYYNNNDGHRVHFVNSDGSTVEDYTTADYISWNDDSFDGVLVGTDDFTSGTYKYFNGTSVYTYSYDPNYQSVGILWDYDSATSNKYALLQVQDSNTNTRSTYVLNSATGNLSASILDYNYNDYNVIFSTGYGSDFITEITYDNNDAKYTRLRIIDPVTLTVKVDENLGIYNVNNYNLKFYGLNKFTVLFSDSSNINTQWLVYDYNSTTDTLSQLTHARGVEYEDYNDEYNNLYNVRRYDRDMMQWWFHSDYSQYIDGYHYYQYMDILALGATGGTPSFYAFANNQTTGTTRGFRSSQASSAVFNTVTVDNDVCVLTFRKDGTSHLEVLINKSGIDSSDYDTFGDKFFISPYNSDLKFTLNDNTSQTYTVLDKNGVTVDAFTFTGTTGSGTQVNVGSYIDYGVLYLYNYNDYTQTKYFNNSNVFTSIGYYNNVDNVDNTYMSDTFKTTGHLVLVNAPTGKMRVINQSNVSPEFDFPLDYDNGYDLNVGSQNFMFIYGNNVGHTVALLYDFSGNVLQTLDTPLTSINNHFNADTRMGVEFNDGGQRVRYMLTPTTVQSVTYDYQEDSTANDIEVYWC
jgi:hypothetical protein